MKAKAKAASAASAAFATSATSGSPATSTAKEPATYVATVRAEVVKPLDTSWDVLGRQLRAISRPLHRVLNKAITELEMMHTGRLLGLEEGNERTAVYQMVRDYWRAEREDAEDRVARGKAYAGDDDIATMAAASSVILGAAGAVWAKWKRYDKDRWKGTSTLPTFGSDQPIEIASSSEAVKMSIEDGTLVLDVRLVADEPRTRVVISPKGGSGYAELRRVAADPDLLGSCKILWDRKWQVLLAVTRTVKIPSGKHVMAIHRGIRTFLTAAITGNDRKDALTMTLADGGDIAAHKKAYAAWRASLGRHQRERGSGARGHGKARRYEAITQLQDNEANWVKTKCQQVAARVMHLAKQRGVSKILIEDWGNPASDGAPELNAHVEKTVRQFPLAELKGAITWAAKNVGIAVDEVPTYNNSRRCPHCEHLSAEAQYPVFRCEKCMLTRPVEMTFAWNMLVDHADASGEALVKANNRALKRTQGRMTAK